ncbi:MAG TPA: BON domain-containing protein [Gemmatimonadales bacterium]
MLAITRRMPWIVGAATLLSVVAGCNRSEREGSAGGDVALDTPAARNAPAPGARMGAMDLDEAEDRIERALRADATLAAFELDADDERGRIVLEGVVETDAQKTRAAEIATSTAPGIPIDNQLRVDAAAARRQAAHAAADEADDRVEDALEADPTLREFDLDVDDEDGRLVLEGTVRTAAQRSQAEEIARRLAPGIPIDNRIRVE